MPCRDDGYPDLSQQLKLSKLTPEERRILGLK